METFTQELDDDKFELSRGSFWLFAAVTTVLGTIVAISFFQQDFRIELAPAYSQVVDFYRGEVLVCAHWALGWLHLLFPTWTMPAWLDDAYVLSFAGGSFVAAALAGTLNRPSLVSLLALAVILGVSFLGYLFIWIAANSLVGLVGHDRSTYPLVALLLSPLLLATAFFVANAYA